MDLSDEAVPAAGYRFYEPRVVGTIAQSFPQPAHRIANGAIEVDEGIFEPEPGADLLAAHDLAAMFQQKNKNLEWLLLDFDPEAVLPQLARARVHFKSAELECPIRH